jgi:hypothetical protein
LGGNGIEQQLYDRQTRFVGIWTEKIEPWQMSTFFGAGTRGKEWIQRSKYRRVFYAIDSKFADHFLIHFYASILLLCASVPPLGNSNSGHVASLRDVVFLSVRRGTPGKVTLTFR